MHCGEKSLSNTLKRVPLETNREWDFTVFVNSEQKNKAFFHAILKSFSLSLSVQS